MRYLSLVLTILMLSSCTKNPFAAPEPYEKPTGLYGVMADFEDAEITNDSIVWSRNNGVNVIMIVADHKTKFAQGKISVQAQLLYDLNTYMGPQIKTTVTNKDTLFTGGEGLVRIDMVDTVHQKVGGGFYYIGTSPLTDNTLRVDGNFNYK